MTIRFHLDENVNHAIAKGLDCLTKEELHRRVEFI